MAAQKFKKNLKINLLPEGDFEKTPLGRFLQWLLSVGRYIVVFTELIVILAFLSRFYLDQKITDLNELIEQKKAIVASASVLEEEIKTANNNFLNVEAIIEKQKNYSGFLKKLNKLIPEGIKFKTFSLENKKITISAESNTSSALNVFLFWLKKSPLIEKISLEGVSIKGNGNINFNLIIFLSDDALN